jgi:hypothetical protein
VSNSLAIATVTATLKAVLKGAIDRAKDQIPGGTAVEVTTVRPNPQNTGMPAKGVNVYLFQVTPNSAWRNADLPARRDGGKLIQKPIAALDLHYLLSFHGAEDKWEQQRVLGIVAQALHSRPTLSRETIKSTVASIGASTGFTFMLKSDLAEQVELVRFTPMSLSLEEMSKVWSVFLQTSYHLSAVWVASVVLIEADETPEPVRAVREVAFQVGPAAVPALERVTHPNGPGEAIVSPGQIVLHGQNLRGDVTRVIIDGVDFTPNPADVTYDRITLTLDPALRAGVRGAQVSHSIQLGSPPLPHRGPESNVAAFILRPTITAAPTKAGIVTAGDGSISANITVAIAPNVGRDQRVVIQLNTLPGAVPVRSYSFTAGPRVSPPLPPPPPDSDASIIFAVAGVRPGTYSVHVLVDGALDTPIDSTRQVVLP